MLLTGIFSIISLATGLAADGWEANVMITSGSAASRLSFGQRSDATDLVDGVYDLPAMLTGDLQVYFHNVAESLWRDIRGMEPQSEWQLVIFNRRLDEAVKVSWDPAALPEKSEIKLIDDAKGIETDMKLTNEYILENVSESLLLIEVVNNN